MKERFTRLYEYNLWANQLFVDVLKSQVYKNEKITAVFTHIGNAQLIWLDRITHSEENVPKVWDVGNLPDAIELVKRSSQRWLDFIYSQEEYENIIEYKNSQGEVYETRISDILTHVANHSTHHRGQLATLLRAEEIDPPASDFIFYIRA
ncbi:DinB family protein [Roseivirga echinicomitans]